MDSRWIDELAAAVSDTRILREPHQIKRFTTGIRFGQGSALVVFEPASLLAFWKILEAAVAADCIVICQAANTGITNARPRQPSQPKQRARRILEHNVANACGDWQCIA